MKKFLLLMFVLGFFVACGNGTNTGNSTDDPSPADQTPSICEMSGGVLINDDTECECPSESIIDPDEACTQSDVSGSSICEQSGGVIDQDDNCICPWGNHIDPSQKCNNFKSNIVVKNKCENTGGHWVVLSNGCGDSCTVKRDPLSYMCTMALDVGCFCGVDQCWGEKGCESL